MWLAWSSPADRIEFVDPNAEPEPDTEVVSFVVGEEADGATFGQLLDGQREILLEDAAMLAARQLDHIDDLQREANLMTDWIESDPGCLARFRLAQLEGGQH